MVVNSEGTLVMQSCCEPVGLGFRVWGFRVCGFGVKGYRVLGYLGQQEFRDTSPKLCKPKLPGV